MVIDVIEGPEINRGTSLEINACGLKGSLRGKNDGCTIMGSDSSVNSNGEYMNDFVIAQDENEGIGERHMIIKYNIQDKSYYIRDLGKGSGTFVRLDQPLVLKNGFIISFGTSHLTVNFFPGGEKQSRGKNQDQDAAFGGTANNRSNGTDSKIQLKFIDGPKLDQTYTFKSSEKITIGRLPHCSILFDDNQLSRLQCVIEYEDNQWILKDADGKKHSTNGTWLFVDELFKTYDGMVFKAGQTLFRTKMIKQQ